MSEEISNFHELSQFSNIGNPFNSPAHSNSAGKINDGTFQPEKWKTLQLRLCQFFRTFPPENFPKFLALAGVRCGESFFNYFCHAPRRIRITRFSFRKTRRNFFHPPRRCSSFETFLMKISIVFLPRMEEGKFLPNLSCTVNFQPLFLIAPQSASTPAPSAMRVKPVLKFRN